MFWRQRWLYASQAVLLPASVLPRRHQERPIRRLTRTGRSQRHVQSAIPPWATSRSAPSPILTTAPRAFPWMGCMPASSAGSVTSSWYFQTSALNAPIVTRTSTGASSEVTANNATAQAAGGISCGARTVTQTVSLFWAPTGRSNAKAATKALPSASSAGSVRFAPPATLPTLAVRNP